MKIELRTVKVRDLIADYKDAQEKGVTAWGGLLDGTSYEGFTEAEDANGNIVKTDTEKNLRKKLEDFMPIYRLKRAVMGE